VFDRQFLVLEDYSWFAISSEVESQVYVFSRATALWRGFFLRRGVAGSSLEFGAGILVQR
jgi:hypothetical protein